MIGCFLVYVLLINTMAYLICGHISYILEVNSKRLNDFSLVGRKPNESLQFKGKRLMVLKFKPELNSKFMLKGSKTIKVMRGSTNYIILNFCHIKKQEIWIYYDNPRYKILFLALLYIVSIVLIY